MVVNVIRVSVVVTLFLLLPLLHSHSLES
jgi:hypothetical protein